jgi:hypothetical protein
MRSNRKKTRGNLYYEMVATPAIDFESILLKKSQRVPEGYDVVRLAAADFPAGWPPGKPYRCQCGCGKTYHIGDRVAYRNVRETEGLYLTVPEAGKIRDSREE